MRRASWWLLLLAGCTFPQTVPEALTNEYVPSGELAFQTRGASYDAVRVRGPKVNLTKRTDGSWGGMLADRAIDVSVTDTAVRGVDFTLSREASTPGHIVITGQFRGKIYRFELDGNAAMVRTPVLSLTFAGRQADGQITAYGPRGELELKGNAGEDAPPWPQFGFGLMATFE